MFRDRKLTRAPAGSDREKYRSSPKSRISGGASGRVVKTQVTKSASDRKLESQKLRLAARGMQYDPHKNKNTWKEKKQEVKTENQPDVAEAEKTEDVQLYKQKMSITPDPERKLVDTEVDKIKDALIDALEPLEDGCYPQFYSAHNVKGVFIIVCANEQTKLWLEKTVSKLQPWEGAKLCAKPKGVIAQGPKVLLKTPKLFAKTDPKKILQMLKTQNKTLDTSTWQNVSVKSEASGQTLVYAVDNQSLEAIRALDNKVYLGLGNIELVILNNEEGGKQTSVDTDAKNDDGDKQTSVDTDMKIKEEADKQKSVDTDMKNEEEADKQTSVDTDKKNEEEGDKQTSVDTDAKNEEKSDKQMSVDTDKKNDEKANKQTS